MTDTSLSKLPKIWESGCTSAPPPLPSLCLPHLAMPSQWRGGKTAVTPEERGALGTAMAALVCRGGGVPVSNIGASQGRGSYQVPQEFDDFADYYNVALAKLVDMHVGRLLGMPEDGYARLRFAAGAAEVAHCIHKKDELEAALQRISADAAYMLYDESLFCSAVVLAERLMEEGWLPNIPADCTYLNPDFHAPLKAACDVFLSQDYLAETQRNEIAWAVQIETLYYPSTPVAGASGRLSPA